MAFSKLGCTLSLDTLTPKIRSAVDTADCGRGVRTGHWRRLLHLRPALKLMNRLLDDLVEP